MQLLSQCVLFWHFQGSLRDVVPSWAANPWSWHLQGSAALIQCPRARSLPIGRKSLYYITLQVFAVMTNRLSYIVFLGFRLNTKRLGAKLNCILYSWATATALLMSAISDVLNFLMNVLSWKRSDALCLVCGMCHTHCHGAALGFPLQRIAIRDGLRTRCNTFFLWDMFCNIHLVTNVCARLEY